MQNNIYDGYTFTYNIHTSSERNFNLKKCIHIVSSTSRYNTIPCHSTENVLWDGKLFCIGC